MNTINGLFFTLIRMKQYKNTSYHMANSLLNIKPGVVINVGANIYTFSIPLAMNYPNFEFIAFERQRTIYNHPVSNVFINQLRNII